MKIFGNVFSRGQIFKGWFLVFAPFSSNGKYVLRSFENVQNDNIYGIVGDDEIPGLILILTLKPAINKI